VYLQPRADSAHLLSQNHPTKPAADIVSEPSTLHSRSEAADPHFLSVNRVLAHLQVLGYPPSSGCLARKDIRNAAARTNPLLNKRQKFQPPPADRVRPRENMVGMGWFICRARVAVRDFWFPSEMSPEQLQKVHIYNISMSSIS